MNLQRLQQLAGLPLSESKKILVERYSESADFDADYDKVKKYLKSALNVIESNNWQQHMRDTDNNFDTRCIEESSKVELAVRDALKALEQFMDEVEKAA